MTTFRVRPENERQHNALKAVFEALEVAYEEEDVNEVDETGDILSNNYLVEKLEQSRKDMKEGKGEKIPLSDLWK
jgi:hypothetical protein